MRGGVISIFLLAWAERLSQCKSLDADQAAA